MPLPIDCGPAPTPAVLELTSTTRQLAAVEFFDLLSELVPLFESEHACVHVWNRAERAHFDSEGLTKDDVLLLTHLKLRQALPTLHWLTALGPAYVDLFGRERVLTTPVHRSRELDTGAVLLQLTAGIRDPYDDFDAYAAARERAMDHLGRDAFRSRATPSCGYRAPDVWTPPEKPMTGLAALLREKGTLD